MSNQFDRQPLTDAEIVEYATTRRNEILECDTAPRREPIQSANIPDLLKAAPQWVLWEWARTKNSPDRWQKVPLNCDGRRGSWTEPTFWMSFAEAAVSLAEQHRAAGVGFVLGGGFAGLDLDCCFYDGQLTRLSRRLIEDLGCYAELSPTSTGVKLFLQYEFRDESKVERWKKSFGIDAHDGSVKGHRWFTVTGQRTP